MNDEQERRRGAKRGCTEQTAAAAGLALSAALVVERLRLEAVLTAQQFVMRVGGNAVVLPHPGFAAVVTIDQQPEAGFVVQVNSYLGQALLADEARRILETGCVEVGGQHAEITEDGRVAVRWRGAYAGQIDVAAVHAALRENLQVAFRVQQALAEDCYLKPAELPETLLQKGRP